jgi:hypothetical protein
MISLNLDHLPTIEVAPIEYHTLLTRDEAIMYCFSLNIDGKTGWRLPTFEEYCTDALKGHNGGWTLDDIHHFNIKWFCYPVRDLKDD